MELDEVRNASEHAVDASPQDGPAAAAPEVPSRPGFFVFVVESPSAPDIYHGRSEGDLVTKATRLDQIPCQHRIAINRIAFQAALQVGLSEAMSDYPDRLPLLHISAHGDETGIQLSNGEVVTWNELRDLLLPINHALNGYLIVCMSCCRGYWAALMAMRTDESPLPYWVLIANSGTPTWSDTAVAYTTLYHLLRRGKTIPEAVEAMKLASGDLLWITETADAAKANFVEFVKTVDLDKARAEMERLAEQNAPPDAKKLEATTSDQEQAG